MQNRAMQEPSQYDSKTLYPLMYLALLLLAFIFLRSFGGTLITFFVIVASSVTAIGIWGWLGRPLNTASAVAPAIVLTVAVADSIHILTAALQKMREGLSKNEAIIESLRVNAHPVTLTSLTTVAGYLALNFSESRPIHDLGNITAIGMAAGWVYSVISLPALMAVIPLKVKARPRRSTSSLYDVLAGLVVRHRYAVSAVAGLLALLAVFSIPRIELDDQFLEYFDDSITFRRDVDFALENLDGALAVQFAVSNGEAGGVSDPVYLSKLEEFTLWLRSHPEVAHVSSLTDIMKQLNRAMHGDDRVWYRLPEERELAAQYLLLYEMSLPYGLDLTNRTNIDKSSSRVGVTLRKITAREQLQFADAAENWLRENTPRAMHSVAAGTPIMFAHISERNNKSMIRGNALALVFITLTITLALRSIPLGLLSLVVNTLPIILTLGVWGLVVGRIGMASAILTATAFGIIVDDTIHFLSKYERARREKKASTREAVLYACHTVGAPMLTTSCMLAVGFGIVATSSFLVNANLGFLMVLAVVFALLCDLFLLPSLLLSLSREPR
jgi:predicted RND superfamily exporter protein